MFVPRPQRLSQNSSNGSRDIPNGYEFNSKSKSNCRVLLRLKHQVSFKLNTDDDIKDVME